MLETRVAILENGTLTDLYVEREKGIVGNIYKGRVENVLPGMEAAFVNIGLPKNAFLYVGDVILPGIAEPDRPSSPPIHQLLKPGQEILLQIERGPIGTKGPRATMRLSLPGRYVVLVGPVGRHVGVSKRIEDPQERQRLRRLGEALRPEGLSLILRTEAEGASEEELAHDIQFLLSLWEGIQKRAQHSKAPCLLHEDVSITYRVCRDHLTSEVEQLLIDDEAEYRRLLNLLEQMAPELKAKVLLYRDPRPLFERYGIEEEIEKATRRTVELASGGTITIDETEALTTIDVNTRRNVGEDAILHTNLEAAEEIARQLRLRDIGGIIIIDFIDMERMRDRVRTYSALERALQKDKARTKIVHISPLALVEMTRKRTGHSLVQMLSETCPRCGGRGRIPSAESIAANIEKEMAQVVYEEQPEALLVRAHPKVIDLLIGSEGETWEALEKRLRRPLYLRAAPAKATEEFQLLFGTQEQVAQAARADLFHPQQVHKVDPSQCFLLEENGQAALLNGLVVILPEDFVPPTAPFSLRLEKVTRAYALGQPLEREPESPHAPPTAPSH